MSKAVKHKHEPLFHITKRADIPLSKSILIRAVAIVLSLVVCSVIIVLLTSLNPIDIFVKMFEGSFGSSRKIWILLQNIAILLCISLAVTPAFKMKFWNLGAEGQVLIGCLATAACMIYLGSALPPVILFPVMVVSAIIAAAIWAFIPAWFQAHYKVNESLFTLMMNYVAIQLVAFFEVVWENPKGSTNIGIINMNGEQGWMPKIFGTRYFMNIVIVVVVTLIMYVYLKYTKQGYEITVVGESQNTARYIGINVKKVIIRTMLISGAICGIAGLLLVSGKDHTLSTDTVGGQGFTAIMVSWLAKFNPFVMVLTTFLIVFLQTGSGEIATAFRLNESLADILTGVILFFIIGCEFFINYKLNFRHKQKEA